MMIRSYIEISIFENVMVKLVKTLHLKKLLTIEATKPQN
jgi:hypothetical protein